jgi:hypothetical protein
MKMGDLLSLISDDILIGLFGGDDIGINDDIMDLELAILESLTE